MTLIRVRPVATAVQGALSALPLPVRWLLLTAVAFGITGGIVGLVLGLRASPSTAWFAVLEVGTPAGCLGALVGLMCGGVAQALGTRH
jgi:hypothetical protein